MRYRSLSILWALVVLVALLPHDAVAQPGTPSKEPVTLTPHGDPDIQGIFTFRTLTPLNRPEALEGKEGWIQPVDATVAASVSAGVR